MLQIIIPFILDILLIILLFQKNFSFFKVLYIRLPFITSYEDRITFRFERNNTADI